MSKGYPPTCQGVCSPPEVKPFKGFVHLSTANALLIIIRDLFLRSAVSLHFVTRRVKKIFRTVIIKHHFGLKLAGSNRLDELYEANIPTKRHSAKASARLSGAYENTRWAQCAECASSQGTQTACEVNGLTHRLPRKARLANKRDFAAVLKQPLRRVQQQGVEVLIAENRLSEARLGIIIGRAYDRRSTERHRFKRLAREAFRRRRHQFAGFDVLVRAKKASDKDDKSEMCNPMQADMDALFDTALLRLDTTLSKNKAASRSLTVRAVLAVLRAYQLILSPLLGQRCRFYPTCSSYAMQAVREHGVVRGLALAVQRIGKCHPWHPGGIDLVPETSR